MLFANTGRQGDCKTKQKKENGMSGAIVKGMAVFAAVLLFPALVLAQGDQAKGKSLFTQQCAGCHGATGKGDGVAAAALNPKPSDLTNKAYMAGLKDQYLFDLIQKGGAAMGKSPLMPPLGSKLKDGDIRDVIAYVRSLAK
jgi:mono/diheme cytochrome c family protein